MIYSIPESTSLPYRSSIIDRTLIDSCYTDSSFKPCPNFTNTLTASRLCGTTTMITSLSTSLLPTNNDTNSSSSPVINGQFMPSKQQSPSLSSPILFIKDNNKLTTSQTSSGHVRKMKVIQSSSSSLSDFISSTPISTLQNTSKSRNIIIQFSSIDHFIF